MKTPMIAATQRPDVQQLLSEMRQLRQKAEGQAEVTTVNALQDGTGQLTPVPASNQTQFGEILTQAIDQVNDVQKESSRLSQAYQQGDTRVSLTDVVVAAEKSSVAFEAMTEVRNRLVKAYEDVMNMPI